MTNLASLSPVDIDTIYVVRLKAKWDASRRLESAGNYLVSRSGTFVQVRYEREQFYVRNDCGIRYGQFYSREEIQPHVLTPEICVAERLAHDEVITAYTDAKAALAAAVAACREIEDIYNAAPWSRYWLVTSSDGHVHRSCHCHTCNKGKQATQFALVPSLSGRDSADAVADLGPALCTACFPEAPVESREQAKVPARLALVLWEEGYEAFQKAREKAAADAKKRAAERCPGSGWQGNQKGYGYVRCTVCGWGCRSTTGLVRPHKGRVS
jgi:hypothetical protein